MEHIPAWSQLLRCEDTRVPKATINTSVIEAIGTIGKVSGNEMLVLDVFVPSVAATDNVFLDLMMHLHVILCACYCSEISPDAI